MKFTICIDEKSYQNKPSGGEIAAVNNRVASKKEELTIAELAEKLSNGHSWCSATFKGAKRNNKEFQQSQLLVLDFDDNTQPETVISTAEEFGLHVNLIYPSFSDTPEYRKFRAVFVLDRSIEDFNLYKKLLKGFQNVFPTCDKACKDACRLWFGGNKPYEYIDETPNTLEAVSLAINAVEVSEATEKNKSRAARKLELYSKSEEKRGAYSIIYSVPQNSSIFEEPPPELPEVLEDIDIEKDLGHLNIIQSMLQGGVFLRNVAGRSAGERLHYNEIFGLVTNLRYIKGGLAWLKARMEEAGHFEDYHFSALYQIRAYDYFPMNMENFSPYCEDWDYVNLLDATGKGGRNIVELENFDKRAYRLEDAEVLFEDAFYKAFAAKDRNIHVFKVPTGLGKTRLLSQTVGQFGNVTYAFTTNALKAEFKYDENVAVATPAMPSKLPADIKTSMEYFFQVGAFREASRVLSDYRKELTAIPLDSRTAEENELLDEIENYSRSNNAAYGTDDKSIVTTHFKALARDENGLFSFQHTDTLVFDEDVVPTLVQEGSVRREDLMLLADRLADGSPLKEFVLGKVAEINKACSYIETSKFPVFTSEEIKQLISIIVAGESKGIFKSNVLDFFRSTYYITEKTDFFVGIKYVVRQTLPNKKVIVFSATADEAIYKQLFGHNKVIFTDLSNVKGKGILEQDSSYSFSRASLENKRVLNYAVKQAGELPVITFQAYKKYFLNPSNMHYGNCSGYNELTGEDIAVVGTPHLHLNTYVLFAAATGYEVKQSDVFTSNKFVTRNGFRFKFRAFDADYMQAVQFYLIEKELLQAVGRARLLRTQSKVRLLSNLPIRYYGSESPELKLTDFDTTYGIHYKVFNLDDIEIERGV